MKKIVILLIVFLVIPSIIFITQKNKQMKIAQQTREEITEIEETVNKILDSDFSPKRKLPFIVEYLDNLIKKMETQGVLGIYVFDREERKRLYNRFIDKAMDFREQLMDIDRRIYSGQKKKELMQTMLQASNMLIQRSPVTNDEDDDKTDIFAMWTDDMKKLVLSDDELPWDEEPEQEAGEVDSELARLDIVDGKSVSEELPRERKYLTEVSRTTVDLDQLKNYIGKKFEIRLKNGDVEEGTLLAVDARSIKLNVFLAGGRASMPIPMARITKAEMLTVKQQIAVESTVTIKEDPKPEDEYKEMQVFDILSVPLERKRFITNREGVYNYFVVTTDYKMYCISGWNGRLLAHSKVTADQFKPLATAIKPWSIRRLPLATKGMVTKGRRKMVRDYPWVILRRNEKTWDGGLKNSLPAKVWKYTATNLEPFELRFKIRLVKKMPKTNKRIEVNPKDLVLSEKNVLMIIEDKKLDFAMEMLGNARFGKGDNVWEYRLVKGISR